MARRLSTLLICLTVGVVLGVSQPLGELWLECSRQQTDACGWDRALLPVTLALGAALGLGFGAILNVAMRAWRERRSRRQDAP
jgi:hypothetical protein